VNTAVAEINGSAQAQAQGIREINAAMHELDSLTQQNAAMVEETTAASVELRSDVMEMRSSASVFTTTNHPAELREAS
jgi:methyl-accepting chemotaxis protein